MNTPTRARDEVILAWVFHRAAGITCGQIAVWYGVGRGQVVVATTNVRDADVKVDGQEAAACYWKPLKGKNHA